MAALRVRILSLKPGSPGTSLLPLGQIWQSAEKVPGLLMGLLWSHVKREAFIIEQCHTRKFKHF